MSVPVSLPTVLAALAQELRLGSANAVALEGLVSEMVRRSTGEERKLAIQEAQGLDALQQHLDVLARFAVLAEAAPPVGVEVAEALDTVPLAQVAGRLRGALHRRGDSATADAPAGDFELF